MKTEYLSLGDFTFEVRRDEETTLIALQMGENMWDSIFSAPIFFDNVACSAIVRGYLTGHEQGQKRGEKDLQRKLRALLGL